MILDKYVKIRVNGYLLKYYRDLGYECNVKDEITINVNELKITSKVKIRVMCDVCGKEKELEYRRYLKSFNNGGFYSCSIKCSKEKRENTNIERYGYKNVFSNSDIQIKIENTTFEKYGVKSPLQNKDIFKKMEQTNTEKYGHKNVFQNDDIKNKIKKTNIEKYGVEHPMLCEEISNKISEIQFNSVKDKVENINKDYTLLKSHDKEYEFYHNICDETFFVSKKLYNYRLVNNVLCPKCFSLSSFSSVGENEIKLFIESLNIDYIDTDKTILKPKHLDIYIPNHNLAIEYNGVYWHSELYKDKNYHLDKTNSCNSKDIQLIHIFEDDWLYKKDIVKSIIKNKLNKIDNKIYARKCVVKEVKSNIARQFLDTNHIQGFSRSKYKFGLYHDNELVSLMTFGYRRTNAKKEFELIRFCNKINTNIIGASSKLFKYFINNYSIEEDYILSYADASMFDGNMYKTLGFDFIHRTRPNYFWVIGDKREHRFKYNKQKLIKEGYDPDLTEVQIMHSRNHYRIYGVGQDRYEYRLK